MFIEFFDWFCNCLTSVFDTMKKFVLFDNFTYYHFCIALLGVAIIFRILKLIMLIEDEEPTFEYVSSSRYISQYDTERWNSYNNKPIVFGSNYKPRHATSRHIYTYIPKHGKRGGSL